MKSVGLSDEVYLALLDVKHSFEKQEGRVLSYDEIIKKLIEKNGNDYRKKVESFWRGGEDEKEGNSC